MRRALLIAVLAFAACSDDTTTSPSQSLNGQWRIISIEPSAQPVQTAPVAAQYQVTFGNERVSALVDCNTCTGSYSVNGTTLTIGPTLACTRAACATASYESAVVTMLSGDHQIATTLHNLTLTSSRGTILLQR